MPHVVTRIRQDCIESMHAEVVYDKTKNAPRSNEGHAMLPQPSMQLGRDSRDLLCHRSLRLV